MKGMIMDPLTLLAWVGVIAVSIIIVAITLLIVWTVIQTIRGKTTARKSINILGG